MMPFAEIGHAGGTFTVTMEGRGDARTYGWKYSHERLNALALLGIWVDPNGNAVDVMPMEGIGSPMPAMPVPGCWQTVLASDSQGRFGHRCPVCQAYWRSGSWANSCPQCGLRAPSVAFLSSAQQRFLEHFCQAVGELYEKDEPGQVVIDLDQIADAASKGEIPAFYASEKSQQKQYTCSNCTEFNDIIGRFGYCSRCGMRNDADEFRNSIVAEIRERLNAGTPPENCLRDGVAAFDSYVSQFAKQLANRVPMIEGRRTRLRERAFHDFEEVRRIFDQWFGIDIALGLTALEVRECVKLFLRRHIHEHNAGIVDAEYLAKSGDDSVQLHQHLAESRPEVHMLLGRLVQLATNIQKGFHEVLPPRPKDQPAYNARFELRKNGS